MKEGGKGKKEKEGNEGGGGNDSFHPFFLNLHSFLYTGRKEGRKKNEGKKEVKKGRK